MKKFWLLLIISKLCISMPNHDFNVGNEEVNKESQGIKNNSVKIMPEEEINMNARIQVKNEIDIDNVYNSLLNAMILIIRIVVNSTVNEMETKIGVVHEKVMTVKDDVKEVQTEIGKIYSKIDLLLDQQAILVTGGQGSGTSSELLFTDGTPICEMPQMSQPKAYHTQSGQTACGGGYSDSERRSCISFDDGSWSTLTDKMVESRNYHSSWINPDGDILLIGGGYSDTTTEIVYQNGTSIRSFDLKYDTRWACSIELPEMFILTGGMWTLYTVSRYTTHGWLEDLPELNEGRDRHGCGFFYNDDMQRVFLVAGGCCSLSSTETLVEGGQAWTFQNPLPSRRSGLRGISLPDTVIMTGGEDYDSGDDLDDVLVYFPESSTWKKTGSMKTGRNLHGASLVNVKDVIEFCNDTKIVPPNV